MALYLVYCAMNTHGHAIIVAHSLPAGVRAGLPAALLPPLDDIAGNNARFTRIISLRVFATRSTRTGGGGLRNAARPPGAQAQFRCAHECVTGFRLLSLTLSLSSTGEFITSLCAFEWERMDGGCERNRRRVSLMTAACTL